MSSTKYTDFTTPAVNAAWLNDVNDNIYDTPFLPPAPGTFRNTLATSAGADKVGFDYSVNYVAGTQGWFDKQQAMNVMCFTSVYNAVTAGTDCTAAVEAVRALMIASGKKALYFPSHTNGYLFNGLAGADAYANGLNLPPTTLNADPAFSIVIYGDTGTIFKCGSNNMVLLRISSNCVTVRDITLDYNGKTNVILCGVVPQSMTQTTTLCSQSFINLINVNRIGSAGVEGIVFQPGPHVAGSDSGCFYHKVDGGYSNFVGGGRHVWSKATSTPTDVNRITRTQFISQRFTRGNVGYQFDVGSEIDLIGCNEELINSGTSPAAIPTARIIGAPCTNINFYGGYSEACTKSVALTASNVRSWGYTPASGSDLDFRNFAESWADNVDGDKTWIPVLNSSGGGTQGASNSTGFLSKHGKLVFFSAQISVAKGTLGAGTLSVSGFPFVADSGWTGASFQFVPVPHWTGVNMGAGNTALQATYSGAAFSIRKVSSTGGGAIGLTLAECSDPVVFTIQGTVKIA